MVKRSSFEIKKKILACLRQNALTFAGLERKINTGYRTIKSNCEELERFGHIKIETIKNHPANGRKAYTVSITKQGITFLEKVKG